MRGPLLVIGLGLTFLGPAACEGEPNSHHPGPPDMEMVCNMGVSPLEKCERLMSYIPPLDWLPFGDWINLPDCEALYGDLPEDTGTCESSWGGWW